MGGGLRIPPMVHRAWVDTILPAILRSESYLLLEHLRRIWDLVLYGPFEEVYLFFRSLACRARIAFRMFCAVTDLVVLLPFPCIRLASEL